nr:four-carbon acid sugar kinase family protein [Clostridium aestuarii]
MIIADDFTGANATGVLLKKNGFKATSFLSYDNVDDYDGDSEVLCINTDTRASNSEDAYKLFKKITESFSDKAKIISKRIDSTLRGNIGSEIDGVLDGLSEEHKAIIVPVYPASGRIAVGGYLLVNGVPLHKTGVAKDPKTPITSSNILEIVKMQTNREVGYIPIEDVFKGGEYLCKQLQEIKEDIIVIDAISEEDIDVISKACIKSQIKFICVDPGPFTQHIASNIMIRKKQKTNKILMVIGSASELTLNQMEYLFNKREVLIYCFDIDNLLDNFEDEAEKACKYILSNCDNYKYICLTTTLKKENILNLKESAEIKNTTLNQLSSILSSNINKVATRVLETQPDIKTVYLSGGDTALGFIESINAKAIEIVDEIIPLAVYGSLIQGKFDGIKVVTKGGLVGEKSTLDDIVTYIEEKSKGGDVCG